MTVAPTTRRGPRRLDGDHGLTRAERSERTATLLAAAAATADPVETRALLDVINLDVINRGVAESVASRYYDRGVDREDLRQVAYEGLTKAVRRFDPATRNDLLTFAVPTIRGELLRYSQEEIGKDLGVTRMQVSRLLSRILDTLRSEIGNELEPALHPVSA